VPFAEEADDPFFVSSCHESGGWSDPSAPQGYLPDILGPYLTGDLPSDPVNEPPYCYEYTPEVKDIVAPDDSECEVGSWAFLFRPEDSELENVPRWDPDDPDTPRCIQS